MPAMDSIQDQRQFHLLSAQQSLTALGSEPFSWKQMAMLTEIIKKAFIAAEGSDFPDVPGLAHDLQKMSGYRNRDHEGVHCADVSTFRGPA